MMLLTKMFNDKQFSTFQFFYMGRKVSHSFFELLDPGKLMGCNHVLYILPTNNSTDTK